MSTLAIIGIVIGAIIALPFILAIFVSRSYSIFRDIIINQPVGTVYEYVRFVTNQEQYSKWVMIDPLMKKTLTGEDGKAGFIYAWDSTVPSAGKGAQEIIRLDKDALVDIEVRFEKPIRGVSKTPLTLTKLSDHQTRITWGMTGKSKYPMNFMNLFMEKILGKDLEESLANLKRILEK